ncbi:MAG: threonine/serine dehydratase [Pseudomonadota bacterium]
MIDRSAIALCHQVFRERFSHFIIQTPLLKLPGRTLDLPCREVWLKLEHLQTSGSFKARGMLNRLLAHPLPEAGVIVASGGNAGIATAAAARELGVRCEVFVPEVCPAAKRDRLAALGAVVVVAGAHYADALQACMARQQETGALLAHAYDQPEVLTGAGTIGLEIEEQGGLPDSVLVSVGGGGLIGGIASWFASRSRVIALEPELAPTLHTARAMGQPVDVAVSGVAADSLGARRIGDWGFRAARAHVSDSLLLTDESISQAQRSLWKSLRLAVEPAAALPLAALQSGRYSPRPDEAVCLVICGANFSPAVLD